MQNRETKRSFTIDVCSVDYVKSVTCDMPISEGFGPGNLISTNAIVRSKGFLAERFIKPPVTLTFDFKCEIDLKYVVIDCCVGAQKTNGIELFAQQSPNQGLYESVASGVLPDDKRGFVFHRYNENVSERFGERYLFRTFKYRSSQHLSSVQSIKIKIFRSGRTCVPALGKLNLFGIPPKMEHPGKSSPTLNGLKRPAHNPSVNSSQAFVNDGPLSTKNRHGNERSSSSVKPLNFEPKRCPALNQNMTIPEDFIDPITCEIMTQPVILPSGKVIDYSTLEKYEKVESSWGRGPNDPFTGLAFNDVKKAVAASDLKARIDKFLTDNCNTTELKSIPRTLGKASSYPFEHQNSISTGIRTSKLISNLPPSTSSSDNDVSAEREITKTHCIATTTKRRKTDSSISSSSDTERNNHLFNTSYCQQKSKKKELFCPNVMETSLEKALKSTLSRLPNLTADKVSEEKETSCQVCTSKDNLFSIPCLHLICRPCLINSRSNNTIVCSKCNSNFKSSDIKKVHLQ